MTFQQNFEMYYLFYSLLHIAAGTAVKSGDEKVQFSDGSGDTLFDTGKSASLKQYQPDQDSAYEVAVLKNKLLCCLTEHERLAVFMSFGIGCDHSLGIREIAEQMQMSVGKIHSLIQNGIIKLKKHASTNSDLSKLLEIVSTNKQNWQLV
jgi:DNA-directed RNA polymerase sigma subunit (sigma70/sigma32)